MNNKGERFKDNLNFELAMRSLLGKSYYGSAGAFDSAKTSKEFLQRAVRRIRTRLREIIVTDERLMFTTSNTLDSLEHYARETSKSVNNDWLIISSLLKLVSLLLGYDWLDGRVHRHVFFFQDRGQEQQDWIYWADREHFEELRKERKHRYMLVSLLKRNNIPEYQIANLLRISLRRVKKILKILEIREAETGEAFPKFDTEMRTNITQ